MKHERCWKREKTQRCKEYMLMLTLQSFCNVLLNITFDLTNIQHLKGSEYIIWSYQGILRKYISIITLITFVIPFIFIVPVFSIHVVDSSLFALLCVVLSTFFVPSRHKLEPSILEALWGSPPQTRNKVIWRSLTWYFSLWRGKPFMVVCCGLHSWCFFY